MRSTAGQENSSGNVAEQRERVDVLPVSSHAEVERSRCGMPTGAEGAERVAPCYRTTNADAGLHRFQRRYSSIAVIDGDHPSIDYGASEGDHPGRWCPDDVGTNRRNIDTPVPGAILVRGCGERNQQTKRADRPDPRFCDRLVRRCHYSRRCRRSRGRRPPQRQHGHNHPGDLRANPHAASVRACAGPCGACDQSVGKFCVVASVQMR